MRISDWSSDVCSSDLPSARVPLDAARSRRARSSARLCRGNERRYGHVPQSRGAGYGRGDRGGTRSEEHTSELQSLMRISYAVFCLKKKYYTSLYLYSHIHNSYIQRTTTIIHT